MEKEKTNMNLSEMKVLLIEDDVFKAVDVNKALTFCGIRNIIEVDNQEEAWKVIYQSIGQGESVEGDVSKCQPGQKIDLIVTDMHYPMAPRTKPDENAGFKLIERLKKEHLYIPVIICSSINYNVPEILGTVWYNKLRDLNLDFKELLVLHVLNH